MNLYFYGLKTSTLPKCGLQFLKPFHLRIQLYFTHLVVARWCFSDQQPHSCSPSQLETLIYVVQTATDTAAQNITSVVSLFSHTALECESSIGAHCFHTAAGQI